jgi:deoxyribonuclease V
LGDKAAARWLGGFVRDQLAAFSTDAPWHRVTSIDGTPTPIPSLDAVLNRLASEGVPLVDERVDIAACVFDAFTGSQPLAELSRQQDVVASRVRIEPLPEITRVGGLDISYAPARNEAVAALTMVRLTDEGPIVEETRIARHSPGLPYITGYLSFRELPVYEELLAEVWDTTERPEVLVVDGSGVIHPRGAGIATHLGVCLDFPTIGVTKKHLAGEVDFRTLDTGEARPVIVSGQTAGYAIRVGDSKRPLFVSPGHRANALSSLDLVRRLFAGHRLPEPIYWADRLSRQAAQSPAE